MQVVVSSSLSKHWYLQIGVFRTLDIDFVATVVLHHINYALEWMAELSQYEGTIQLLHYFYVYEA